jgi:predicted component of type VI protein secretion system
MTAQINQGLNSASRSTSSRSLSDWSALEKGVECPSWVKLRHQASQTARQVHPPKADALASTRRESTMQAPARISASRAAARDMLAAARILEAMGRDLTDDERRALDMLAGSQHGCTEAILRANGFGVGLLADLMRTGLAKAEAETTQAGPRVRIRITDAGKRALAG